MQQQYRNQSPKVYKLQLRNLYDARKRVNTQVDDHKCRNNNSQENYSPQGWKFQNSLISKRTKRLSTQYPETESESIYPFILSPKQPLKSKRTISQKRNQSISDYNNSPSFYNFQLSPKRGLFTSIKSQRNQNSLGTKLLNISNLLTPVDIKNFMAKWELSQEEWDRFGNRFPITFQREKLLGRGGFSLIWHGKHLQNGQHFAIKQIPKKSKHETHYKELAFCNQFFNKGGQIKSHYQHNEGVKHLCKMYDFIIDSQDIFIIYEICGMSLGTQLYDFDTQNNNTYKLIPQKLVIIFKQMPQLLFKFIKKLAFTIDILSKSGWVHSDIKSENILINYGQTEIEVKLVDYGSSFRFAEVFEKFSMATPEYMCPEMLTFILKENQMSFETKYLAYLEDYNREWVIDIWGVGCVILEIVSGIPLWMSFDTQVTNLKGKQVVAQGLFAVQGRAFNKIVEKQIKVIQNIDEILREQNYSGIVVNQLLSTLIKGMLTIDPSKRMSPSQILSLLVNY